MQFISREETAEKKADRISKLMLNHGLSRENATWVDDQVMRACDRTMSIFEKELVAAGQARPELGLTTLHTAVVIMEKAFIEAHNDFHKDLDDLLGVVDGLVDELLGMAGNERMN